MKLPDKKFNIDLWPWLAIEATPKTVIDAIDMRLMVVTTGWWLPFKEVHHPSFKLDGGRRSGATAAVGIPIGGALTAEKVQWIINIQENIYFYVVKNMVKNTNSFQS